MSNLIKIAVDAMGGDGSPKKVIDGIIYNHQSNKNIFYKIFGDKNKISIFLSEFQNIEDLLEYFEEFDENLSKKNLNYYLKSVSNP